MDLRKTQPPLYFRERERETETEREINQFGWKIPAADLLSTVYDLQRSVAVGVMTYELSGF